MLAKCTNVRCSAEFRYLHGKLFRLEMTPKVGVMKAKSVEYFWLCTNCSVAMTLNLSQDGRVVATGLAGTARGGTHLECIAMIRNHGRLLVDVSFLPIRTSAGAQENP